MNSLLLRNQERVESVPALQRLHLLLCSCAFQHVSQLRADARIRYAVQKAEAYQGCLAAELQQHFTSLIQQELYADV